MPSPVIVDPLSLDIERPIRGIEDIRRHNRQRFEMEMLSGICVLDMEKGLIAGFKRLSADEFWVRGHIPGRPLLPGVLQIEAAAQLTSYYYMETAGTSAETFLGFMGVTDVKFRGIVQPGEVLILAGQLRELRPGRRCTFYCQCFVKEKMVFEGTIIGAPV